MIKNKISYDIDVNSKIIMQQYVGEIASFNIIKTNRQIIKDPRFHEAFNWIIDIRSSKQLFAKCNSFIDFFKKNITPFENVKMAFIIGSPKQSMSVNEVASLFENNHINIVVKKAINKDFALKWIVG